MHSNKPIYGIQTFSFLPFKRCNKYFSVYMFLFSYVILIKNYGYLFLFQIMKIISSEKMFHSILLLFTWTKEKQLFYFFGGGVCFLKIFFSFDRFVILNEKMRRTMLKIK